VVMVVSDVVVHAKAGASPPGRAVSGCLDVYAVAPCCHPVGTPESHDTPIPLW